MAARLTISHLLLLSLAMPFNNNAKSTNFQYTAMINVIYFPKFYYSSTNITGKQIRKD